MTEPNSKDTEFQAAVRAAWEAGARAGFDAGCKFGERAAVACEWGAQSGGDRQEEFEDVVAAGPYAAK